jgi:nitronate monooxygenase
LNKWPTTTLAKTLGIKIPIVQAPMAGGATTPELVAAVSNAGGLGSLAAGYLNPDDIRKNIFKIRQLTDKPFAVNLFVSEEHQATKIQIKQMCHIIEKACVELKVQIEPIEPPYAPEFDEQLKVILEEKISIFSFTFGMPSQTWLKKFKKNKTLLLGTATTLKEAQQLQEQGIDIIIGQGSEAGGHRGTFIGSTEDALINISVLVPQLAKYINVPIVAAGGIMDANGIIAAMHLGAAGVQMGTAFLSCPESGIHPKYKEALLNAKQDNTVLTRAFSGKLARGINNKFIKRMQIHEKHILDYPIQNALTRTMRKIAEKNNCIDFMALWAGQAAHLSKAIPAAELIKKLHKNVVAQLDQML